MNEAKKEGGMLRTTVVALGFILRFFKPYAIVYTLGMLIWASQDFLGNMTFALFYRNLTFAVTDGGIADVLGAIGLFFALQIGYLIVFNIGSTLGMQYSKIKVQAHLEKSLLGRLLHVSGARHTGQDATLFTSDTDNAINAASYQSGHIFMAAIALIGSAVVIGTVDWRLMALCIAAGVIFMLIDIAFAKPMRDINAKIQRELGNSNQRLSDIIAGALTVRLLNLLGPKCAEYRQAVEAMHAQGVREARLNVARGSIDTWRNWIVSIGIMGVGCIYVARGEYPLADLMMLLPLIGQLLFKFTLISWAILWAQRGVPSAQRIREAFERPAEDARPNGAAVVPQGDTAIELRDVSFTYPGRDIPVLNAVNFSVGRGEVVALVGESGSGKTTVFRLLLGLLSPSSGLVRQWGTDLAAASIVSWRSGIAYVAQEAPLFDGTIGENIAFGRLGCPMEAVEKAAQDADLNGFIAGAAAGLDTPAGTLGGRISGGQRQRVAIARAFVRDAPLLLLDEATSALDAESESDVQASIDRLMRGRTVVVSAHRLSTIRGADRIVVLEGGTVAETGTHDELIARGGVYARLWEAQRREV